MDTQAGLAHVDDITPVLNVIVASHYFCLLATICFKHILRLAAVSRLDISQCAADGRVHQNTCIPTGEAYGKYGGNKQSGFSDLFCNFWLFHKGFRGPGAVQKRP